MRTVHCSGRRGGGVYLPGGVCPDRRLSAQTKGGVYPGVSDWGSVYPSMQWGRHPSWTESQTLVKILPCRNYVADGNILLSLWYRYDVQYIDILTKRKLNWNNYCCPIPTHSPATSYKICIPYVLLIDIALSHGCVCVLLPVSCCVSSSFPQ